MTKVIAHRGYSGKYPENTMLAFKKAYEAKAYGIELDIHLSKDGNLIICHDEKIDRTSNGKGYIKDMTLEEIKQFNFLNNLDIEVQNKEDIKAPTLREFYNWFKYTNMILNIEIKNNIFRYPTIVDKVLELTKEYDVEDRIIISSFNHHTIREVKDKNKNIKCGFLTACSILEPGEYCKKYNVECYHPLFISLDQEDFKNLKDNKIEINTWTVNEKEHMLPLIKEDVETIITNNVELAMDTINNK